MKNKKNKIALLLAGLLGLTSFSACGWIPKKNSSEEGSSSEEISSVEEDTSTKILCEALQESTIKVGKEQEITVGKEVGDRNYFTIQLTTTAPLVGYIHYTDPNNAAKTHKEKFFIEQGAESFSMFLDGIRIGAFGAFEKRIDKITLQNVGDVSAKVKISQVAISDRTYDNQEMLYLDNGMMKVGASLAAGGALYHLECLNRNVVEYVDKDGKVRIDEGIDASTVNLVTDQVNLINVHDLGREVQQSYYSNAGEENGYKPDDEVIYNSGFGGGYKYNPVQAGSAGDNQTQIIDYELTKNKLYIKCRPQDWFFDNTQTDSYMESTYTFDKGGSLIVTNRFINFAQFTNMDGVIACNQEIPAVYIVHPLNYFYCETVEGVINDPGLSPIPTSDYKSSLSEKKEGNYWYQLPASTVVGSWLANVNDKGFGLGMYIPNVERYSASRGWKSTSYEMYSNHYYDSNIYDLRGVRLIPSMYVDNYNYFSPAVTRKMVDFVPFEYSFALYIGRVEEMRERFGWLKENETIKNEGLDYWSKI